MIINLLIRCTRLFLLGGIVYICLSLGAPWTSVAENNGSGPGPVGGKAPPAESSQAEADRPVSLIEIYTWSGSLPKELIDLQNDIDQIADVEALRQELPDIEKQIEEFTWRATELKANPNLTFHEITLFENNLVRLAYMIDAVERPTRHNIERLERWYDDWSAKEAELARVRGQAERDSRIGDTLPASSQLTETVQKAKKLIEERLRASLLLGNEIGNLHLMLYELNDIAGDLVRDMNELGIEQTSPSMFSADFYDHINSKQLVNAWQNIRLFATYQWAYLKEKIKGVAICSLLLIFFAYLIFLSKPLVMPSSRWYPFAVRPLTTAVFVCGSAFAMVNALNLTFALPPDWDSLLMFPLIVTICIFARDLSKVAWQVTLFRQLMVLLIVFLLTTAANLPQVIMHLYVLVASLALFGYYLITHLGRRKQPGSAPAIWATAAWSIFPLLIIGAGLAGFDQLAVMLFGRILSFLAATVLVRLLFLLSIGLLELLLIQVPWAIIKRNAASIVSQLQPLIALLFVLLWVAVTLLIFFVFPTLNSAYEEMAALSFTIYSVTITPESVLILIVIVYATLLVSRGIRAFLLQDILPHYRVDIGVQISITRLVHYAILVVGFLVLLSMLGFGINQITILGGALGVGIGFGLQAIVNNFVSGLILLFERPIKVGDILEVGPQQIGEVKELGLRATTVQTFDNAEIVIPNSQLVTGSVTNWTLAEKKVRVRVPVGVAYGTDITKVLEILLTCANEHPAVLSTPKPAALFLAFGSSSLDFELRVWISDINDRLTIHSELNQQIEMEFDLGGVEIPFPQRDLHIRSIDEGAAEKLAGQSPGPAKVSE